MTISTSSIVAISAAATLATSSLTLSSGSSPIATSQITTANLVGSPSSSRAAPTAQITMTASAKPDSMSVAVEAGIGISSGVAITSFASLLGYFILQPRRKRHKKAPQSGNARDMDMSDEFQFCKPEMSSNFMRHELPEQRHANEMPGVHQHHELDEGRSLRELDGDRHYR